MDVLSPIPELGWQKQNGGDPLTPDDLPALSFALLNSNFPLYTLPLLGTSGSKGPHYTPWCSSTYASEYLPSNVHRVVNLDKCHLCLLSNPSNGFFRTKTVAL